MSALPCPKCQQAVVGVLWLLRDARFYHAHCYALVAESRYIALRDAVREERDASANHRAGRAYLGVDEEAARRLKQARAAVDRALDEGGK